MLQHNTSQEVLRYCDLITQIEGLNIKNGGLCE